MRVVRHGASCVVLIAGGVGAQGLAPTCATRGIEQWQATRPSPLDSATLTVGGRIAVICYSRPSVRGRSIDSLVPYGHAWRTGANEPTTIALTGRLSVGGVALDSGRYVILTVPRADQWSVVFHTTPETEPAKMFAKLHQVAIGSGLVEKAERPVEQFTIRPVGDSTAPAFLFEWGERRARVPVRPVP